MPRVITVNEPLLDELRKRHQISEEAVSLIKRKGIAVSIWRFPTYQAKPFNLADQLTQINHEVVEATIEYEEVGPTNDLAMELWDIIHACETALKGLAQEPYGIDVHAAKIRVEDKNHERGYYRTPNKEEV